mmetsp:Transcript_53230/g.171724  ORF Transcript_53230/g.171724 Transcript_53230/m.171724 type:complete len:215 (+) Transcript_53230:199-843(+)
MNANISIPITTGCCDRGRCFHIWHDFYMLGCTPDRKNAPGSLHSGSFLPFVSGRPASPKEIAKATTVISVPKKMLNSPSEPGPPRVFSMSAGAMSAPMRPTVPEIESAVTRTRRGNISPFSVFVVCEKAGCDSFRATMPKSISALPGEPTARQAVEAIRAIPAVKRMGLFPTSELRAVYARKSAGKVTRLESTSSATGGRAEESVSSERATGKK